MEVLLCGGTEEYDSGDFKMIAYEPPEPFKLFSDVTEVTSPYDRVFYNISWILSVKMNAFIRELEFETGCSAPICDGVEWIPDDKVSKSAIINITQWGM